MTDQKNPTEITEDKLDDISGGPHFRTWDNTYYDYHGGCDVVLAKAGDTKAAASPMDLKRG